MTFARQAKQPFVSLLLMESVIGQVTQGGDSEAVFLKGQALLSGGPAVRDDAGARRSFEQAVEAGHVKASGMLGYMLAAGLGGPKDEQRAVELIRRAADAGIVSARLNLGIMLLNGSGTPRDVTAAVGLLEKAGEHGSIEAHRRLGDLYYFGADGIPVDYSKALAHVKAAAVAGNSDARNVLGTMFEFGQGTAASHTDAIYWYRQAAEQNHSKAQSNLARMIRLRGTRDADVVESYQWLVLAAGQGEITAKIMLADCEKGISLRQKAAAEEEIRKFREKSATTSHGDGVSK
jgi:TPR repeat protein